MKKMVQAMMVILVFVSVTQTASAETASAEPFEEGHHWCHSYVY